MHIRELLPHEWASFCDGFTRSHWGCPVTIEVRVADVRDGVIARDVPLVGIAAELRGPRPDLIEVIAGDMPDGLISHTVHAPKHLRVAQSDGGVDDALIIESGTDGTTVVDLRVRAGQP